MGEINIFGDDEEINNKTYYVPEYIINSVVEKNDVYDENCKYYPSCPAITGPPYNCKGCIEHYDLGKY